jgi:orotate phosphoribosyltransferase
MDRRDLIRRIMETAYLEGDFVLRSGKRSKYYLDKYLFESKPDILRALGDAMADLLPPDVDVLAGPELGGIPLATVLSLKTQIPFVIVRKEAKSHGTAKRIEGFLKQGDRVVIVEDVMTTGGQSIESAKALEEAGAVVRKIVCVIDREEGTRASLDAAGYAFEPLLTKTDLGI